MAVSFFNHLCNKDYDIVVFMRDEKKLEKLNKSYSRLKNNKKDVIQFTTNLENLQSVDLIIEFVSEDLNLKRDMIHKLLSCQKNKNQVIATCSSSFTPARISDDYGKENIMGIHFIYPVQFMKSVEIIVGDDTDEKAILAVKNFLELIDKDPILVDQKAGVFSVKLLSCIQNEAFRLFNEYQVSPGDIDDIIIQFQFAMPPFDLIDSVGFEIISNCTREFYEGTQEYPYYEGLRNFLEDKMKNGMKGKKSGKGFYDYSGPCFDYLKDYAVVNEGLKDIITERIKMIYINNAFRLINESLINCVEVDNVMREVNQSEKGPLQLAFEEGIEQVYAKMTQFEKEYGLPFKPPKVIEYIIENQVGRDEIDRQIRLFKMGGNKPDWYNKNMGETG